MSSNPTLEVLRAAARALARDDGLESTLLALLHPVVDRLDVASAAVFTTGRQQAWLEIAASIGVGDPAALAAAVRNPAHPVARTAAQRTSTFDVEPMAPGGPALRGHLPLVIGAGSEEICVGVLALAYDQPIEAEDRSILTAVAELAAVAIERDRSRHRPA